MLLLLISFPAISADDITFTLDQKEYYFLTGEQAIIPLSMNNTYEKDIQGSMSYQLTQTVQQGGSSYSSTNSQSQSFSVPKGNTTIQINFGRSDQPLQLDAELTFSYQDNNKDHMVSLENIRIYFVSNESQKNNQQNPQQSSSEEVTNAEPNHNNQQQTQQTPQQKLQNNQMNQDSQALKDQIQQQLAEEQAQEDAFEQNLMNNSAMQQLQQELLDQNYSMKDKQLAAESNDTGDFNFTYENKQGETASLKGRMENGTLQNVQKQTAEDREQMLEALNQSQQFQEYENQLNQEGFNQTDVSFQQQGNKTTVNLEYQNEKNETATITAEFKDEQLQEVRLSKDEPLNMLFWLLPIIVFLVILLIFLYYRYFHTKHQQIITPTQSLKKPFDYKKEARNLLVAAERLYKEKRYKDAYGKAGQALRLYLSYEHGLKRELTNDDVIRFLKNKQYPYQQIKHCFDLCSLVEFAKYQANNSDFDQIKTTVGKTIKHQHNPTI